MGAMTSAFILISSLIFIAMTALFDTFKGLSGGEYYYHPNTSQDSGKSGEAPSVVVYFRIIRKLRFKVVVHKVVLHFRIRKRFKFLCYGD